MIFVNNAKLFLQRFKMVLIGATVFWGHSVFASSGAVPEGANIATVFLWIAILLLAAKFSGFVAAFGQPAVLGELLIGVFLGNLALIGINFFEPIAQNEIIHFLAELGVVILLFQIGLESNIAEMQRTGPRAVIVAVVGVIVPFVLGTYVVGPWLFPELSLNAHLFLGATLTATSVGITGRVFKDLHFIKEPEAQIVLGAAVIDDVLGLIILAIVSAIVTLGAVSFGAVSFIIGKAVLFLVGAIVVGQLAAPRIGRLFSLISTGVGMKFTLAVSFGLVFSYLASAIGLAPIVGAFAAGLILDSVHFQYFKDPKVIRDVRKYIAGCDETTRVGIEAIIEPHAKRHLDSIVEPVGYLVVPIFFVVTGMNVNVATFTNPRLLVLALAVTVVAFIGKLAAGLVAGPVRKLIVGFGMVPRGEVGLIFATVGRSLGVVSEDVYSVIVIMVIVTTIFTPPILTRLIKQHSTEPVVSGK
ncbi:MAG: cation:proton antiporter [Patescibacteria group bacterium]|jgi:Kef-type K+ transport system membrane component KefB